MTGKSADWWEKPEVWDSLESEYGKQLAEKAGFASFREWAEAYKKEHNAYPGSAEGQDENLQQAIGNLLWSQDWAKATGQSPTQAEWEAHYYDPENMGDAQHKYWRLAGDYLTAAQDNLVERVLAQYAEANAQPRQNASKGAYPDFLSEFLGLPITEQQNIGIERLNELNRQKRLAEAATLPGTVDRDLTRRPYDEPTLGPYIGPQLLNVGTVNEPEYEAALAQEYLRRRQQLSAEDTPLPGTVDRDLTRKPYDEPTLGPYINQWRRQRQYDQPAVASKYYLPEVHTTAPENAKTDQRQPLTWQDVSNFLEKASKYVITEALPEAIAWTPMMAPLFPNHGPYAALDAISPGLSKKLDNSLNVPAQTFEQALGAYFIICEPPERLKKLAERQYLRQQILQARAAGLDETELQRQYKLVKSEINDISVSANFEGFAQLWQADSKQWAAAWEAGRAGLYTDLGLPAMAYFNIMNGMDPEEAVQDAATLQDPLKEFAGQLILDPVNLVDVAAKGATAGYKGVEMASDERLLKNLFKLFSPGLAAKGAEFTSDAEKGIKAANRLREGAEITDKGLPPIIKALSEDDGHDLSFALQEMLKIISPSYSDTNPSRAKALKNLSATMLTPHTADEAINMLIDIRDTMNAFYAALNPYYKPKPQPKDIDILSFR